LMLRGAGVPLGEKGQVGQSPQAPAWLLSAAHHAVAFVVMWTGLLGSVEAPRSAFKEASASCEGDDGLPAPRRSPTGPPCGQLERAREGINCVVDAPRRSRSGLPRLTARHQSSTIFVAAVGGVASLPLVRGPCFGAGPSAIDIGGKRCLGRQRSTLTRLSDISTREIDLAA
jgi:hypothetical protein